MMQGAKSEVLTPAVASAKPSPTPVGTPVGGDSSKSPGQKMTGAGVKYAPLHAFPDHSKCRTNPDYSGPSMLPTKVDAEKEDGEIDDSSKKDATRRTMPTPQIQDTSKVADNGRRVANLPQRPGPIPPPLRRQPSREPPRPQQTPQQQLVNEPMRANTPRRDDNMPVRAATELVMRPNAIQNTRVIVQQQQGRPQPQHQLPDRPQTQQPQHGRVADRDLRDLVRDSRPQVEIRGRPSGGERLPERPGQERRQPSPRRDSGGRDIRDPHRREVERPRGGRDESFQRPALPSRDDRGQRGPERKEPDIVRMDGTPQRQNQPPQQTPPSRSDSRVPTPDLDRTRRGDRVDDRSRRHEQLRQGEPIVIDRLEHSDRRILERRLSDQAIPRQQEEPHLQRPPAGPRADVERDRRNRQQVESTGPPTPKDRDQRDLFPGAPIRAPSGPSIQDHRDQQRHIAVQPHHQDPNHGRLNPPDLIIPKGPRDRNPPHGPRGGPARASTGLQTPATSGMRIPGTPVGGGALPPLQGLGEKLMITLPAEKPEQKQSLSTPSTPGVDTAGIHPDRLRAMGVSEGPGSKSSVMSANATPRGESRQEARERGERGEQRDIRSQLQLENRQQTLPVHPSRMGSIQASSITSISGTSTPPSGPRGGGSTLVEKLLVAPLSSTPVPNKPGEPPTGPSTSRPDRGDEAHQRRRMQAMQNLLGQASDIAPQGNVIRGRARRGNGTTGNGSTSGREQSSRTSLNTIETSTGGGSGRRSIVAVDGRRASTTIIAPAELPAPSPRSLSGPGSTEERGGSEGSRSGRHGRERDGREGRGEGRDREVRERGGERDRERERERERGDRDVLRDRDVIRERDRETRERHPDRDRGIERERDRERERVERERAEPRRDSERGGSSTDRKDRERSEREPRGADREPRGAEPRDRGDRERDVRERERERERDRERRDRKHGREESGAGARGEGGRKEEPKRRRRGGDTWQ